ncbi:DUF3986 family protein (plasmid) [Cytobacillus pseudoceanisediminis]|uniref:DUF3986 family protein n=1 Tax=Cytobacillus pseudoceanisediminis TaxID=3051614 RepID=UPI002187DB9C|nr:DUF3986 family protein [Cytobacillus pseudoceanisediminis]UQX57117.1 DUF3986 family protein [Cytobacillus pseudoceanisediminis]
MLYEDKYHMHLGYYEKGFDLEAVALKRHSQATWDVFFDFRFYGFNKPIQENNVYLKGFGTKIFQLKLKNLILMKVLRNLNNG